MNNATDIVHWLFCADCSELMQPVLSQQLGPLYRCRPCGRVLVVDASKPRCPVCGAVAHYRPREKNSEQQLYDCAACRVIWSYNPLEVAL